MAVFRISNIGLDLSCIGIFERFLAPHIEIINRYIENDMITLGGIEYSYN